MTRWNRTEVETLIQLYQNNPFLYDTKHVDYHKRVKRDKTLTEIAEKINEIRGNNLTLADIKAKIKTLRTQYGAEKQHMAVKLYNISTTKTEDGVPEVYEPKLWCYETLKFLDDYMKDRLEWSVTGCSTQDELKPKTLTARLNKSPGVMKSMPGKNDKEDIFANFVAYELRQITDSTLYHETKWKIQLALKEGVEKQMELNADGLITEVVVE